ncbi:MAG: serine protease [Roseiflexaceae bacterium]
MPSVSDASADQPRRTYLPAQVPIVNPSASWFESRIVGGTVATQHEFPWQVYLVIKSSWTCGASVIKQQYILTAAHCVTDDGSPVAASQIKAYMGMHDKRYLTSTVQSRTGSRLFVHASYNPEVSEDYDIAVVKLNAPLTINRYVKTIRLAKANETNLFAAGNDVTVSGWGTTSYGGSTSNYLRKTTVDIVSRATCNRSNSYAGAITNRMLCAARASKDSCQGDSGGPLFLRRSGMYKQVGVVSFGVGCANPSYPGVYAHVGVLRNWVATKVPSLP